MRTMAFVIVVCVVGCRRPLAPGETRCYSTRLGAGYATKCETGAERVAETPRPAAFYCASLGGDPVTCFRTLHECDLTAARTNGSRPPADREIVECHPAASAWCFRAAVNDSIDESCWGTMQHCRAFMGTVDANVASLCRETE